MTNVNELACAYSALILADDDVAVTADKINTLLKAANVTIEPIWPTLFARALTSIDIKALVANAGSAAPSAAPAAAPAQAAAPAAAKKEEKKEEKKEDSEEEDGDMGFGLFD